MQMKPLLVLQAMNSWDRKHWKTKPKGKGLVKLSYRLYQKNFCCLHERGAFEPTLWQHRYFPVLCLYTHETSFIDCWQGYSYYWLNALCLEYRKPFQEERHWYSNLYKTSFADALVDVETSTIIRKLRMEGTCIIELLPSLDVQGGIKTNYCCW